MTRGAITTFSIDNDAAKYFAILPAIFVLNSTIILRIKGTSVNDTIPRPLDIVEKAVEDVKDKGVQITHDKKNLFSGLNQIYATDDTDHTQTNQTKTTIHANVKQS